MTATSSLNPRYVAYAHSCGMSPEKTLRADRAKYPGGRMAGFIVWNMQRIAEYLAETGLHRTTITLHPEQYNEWLARRYAPGQIALPLEIA